MFGISTLFGSGDAGLGPSSENIPARPISKGSTPSRVLRARQTRELKKEVAMVILLDDYIVSVEFY